MPPDPPASPRDPASPGKEVPRPYPDHFSRTSEGYRAHRPGYPTSLVHYLADAAGAEEVAWDAGCGSGQLSRPLARRFRRVIATDASPEQISAGGRIPGVEFLCAPAEAPGLPPSSVDLSVAAQAAHWFDLARYYAQVRRVTRPGGLVALVSYGLLTVDPGGNPAPDRTLRRFYQEVLGPHWPPERRHVEEGYATLPFPFPELTPPKLEIRRNWSLNQLLGYVDTWSAVRSLERSGDRGTLMAFHREMERAWGAPEVERAVLWPLALRVGRVTGKPAQRP